MLKADWKKSVWKAVKVIVLVYFGSKVTPDQITSILPDDVAKLTIGALLVGALNFAKYQWGDKIPFLKKV